MTEARYESGLLAFGRGKVANPPKEELKGRLGRSPNRVDAVAMALGVGPRHEPFVR